MPIRLTENAKEDISYVIAYMVKDMLYHLSLGKPFNFKEFQKEVLEVISRIK